MTDDRFAAQKEVLGHPTGLFTLFFAEMWERFSYYGMRALLVFYMLKGFLGYGDRQAYSVYGAYTALVYMTPFIGGMLADRFLGQRRAIVMGGLLMAAGHLLMTVEAEWPFFFALALLICGNGFFKPNISTTVGTLYRPGSPKRDDGFNIFYMGINLGAAMSPLLCGYIGETYGWHYGFGLATIGMLTGLAVFVMPNRITQLMVGGAALASAIGLLLFRPDNAWAIGFNIFVALALVTAAFIACTAIGRGGLPEWAGRRPEGRTGASDWKIFAGIALAIPTFALLVSGFSPLRAPAVIEKPVTAQENIAWLKTFGVEDKVIDSAQKAGDLSHETKSRGEEYRFIPGETIDKIKAKDGIFTVVGEFVGEVSKPAGLVLTLLGLLAFGYLFVETFRLKKVQRERMLAALALIFFQMLFFAFFEQAGSSTNNFTDRNVDRVGETRTLTAADVGHALRIQPTQEQLGFDREGTRFSQSALDKLRGLLATDSTFTITWPVTEKNVGMHVADRVDEIPASLFQAVNPAFILIFALVFNILWAFLRRFKLDPSAPLKFAFGLVLLGLGFGAYWMGAQNATDRGMVNVVWLLLGYLLQTQGELCLSPVGLSAMTKLAPRILVSTMMGAWFLATAFSQYLAGIISQFTGVSHGKGGDLPAPIDTVHVYGGVFGNIAITAMICGAICALMSPLLKKWMHQDTMAEDSI